MPPIGEPSVSDSSQLRRGDSTDSGRMDTDSAIIRKKVAFTRDNLQSIVQDEVHRLNPLANTFEPSGCEPATLYSNN